MKHLFFSVAKMGTAQWLREKSAAVTVWSWNPGTIDSAQSPPSDSWFIRTAETRLDTLHFFFFTAKYSLSSLTGSRGVVPCVSRLFSVVVDQVTKIKLSQIYYKWKQIESCFFPQYFDTAAKHYLQSLHCPSVKENAEIETRRYIHTCLMWGGLYATVFALRLLKLASCLRSIMFNSAYS